MATSAPLLAAPLADRPAVGSSAGSAVAATSGPCLRLVRAGQPFAPAGLTSPAFYEALDLRRRRAQIAARRLAGEP